MIEHDLSEVPLVEASAFANTLALRRYPQPGHQAPLPRPAVADVGCGADTVGVSPLRPRGVRHDSARVVVVPIVGDLDLDTAPDFARWLRPLAAGGHRLILDLSGMSFLGCAGLTLFVQLNQDAAASGGSLHLISVPAHPLRLLLLTGLLDTVSGIEADPAAVPGKFGVAVGGPDDPPKQLRRYPTRRQSTATNPGAT
jgi:anti-anti-sigma factor